MLFLSQEDAVDKIFSGNQDSNISKKNPLKYPINTKSVQFLPLTWSSGIALRVAVYGFTSGIYLFAQTS